MAFRRYRKYRPRRPYRARRLRRAAIRRVKRRIPRGVSTQANIPRMQKMRYVQDVALTMTAGATSKYEFRANSIYDPDYSGGGHQPMRFDQMAAFYADYVVVASKITVRHMGAGGSNAPYKIALYLNDTNTGAITSINDLIEQGRCRFKVTTAGVQHPQDKITLGFSAKKFFGVANIKDNVDRLGAPCTTNPADQAIYVLCTQPVDAASSITGEVLSITIDYLVWFNQPIQLQTS